VAVHPLFALSCCMVEVWHITTYQSRASDSGVTSWYILMHADMLRYKPDHDSATFSHCNDPIYLPRRLDHAAPVFPPAPAIGIPLRIANILPTTSWRPCRRSACCSLTPGHSPRRLRLGRSRLLGRNAAGPQDRLGRRWWQEVGP
jgi:hypothetical protein